MFILSRDENIIKREDNSLLEFSYIENQLYEPKHFCINDFTDTGKIIQFFQIYLIYKYLIVIYRIFFPSDDFGGTIEVENIIKTLDEDDLLVDNETNKLWKNEYEENQDEIQDKFYILFKEFNNF